MTYQKAKMIVVERVKIFTGADTTTLEDMYAEWYDDILEYRAQVPALKGTPFKILDRNLVIRNYKGDETFALCIFYEDTSMEAHEVGPDRGGHLRGGVSMMVGQRPQRRRPR